MDDDDDDGQLPSTIPAATYDDGCGLNSSIINHTIVLSTAVRSWRSYRRCWKDERVIAIVIVTLATSDEDKRQKDGRWSYAKT